MIEQIKKNIYLRYDYLLIWGHGLQYKNEIIDEIESSPNFKIEYFINHKPKSIKKLVNEIYSYDYAPVFHLKAKTKYLLKTPKEVLFIFLQNIDPIDYYSGKGEFRHLESQNAKILKEKIRDKFNERKRDRRTENHVIHISDNELQVDRILKYLGKEEGINFLKGNQSKVLDIPQYLKYNNSFNIEKISTDHLFCRIPDTNGIPRIKPVKQSPQYQHLEGKKGIYSEYLERNLGKGLKAYYSVRKFNALIKSFDYQKGKNNYILVEKLNDSKYVILDGLHRASILLSKNKNKIIVAILL